MCQFCISGTFYSPAVSCFYLGSFSLCLKDILGSFLRSVVNLFSQVLSLYEDISLFLTFGKKSSKCAEFFFVLKCLLIYSLFSVVPRVSLVLFRVSYKLSCCFFEDEIHFSYGYQWDFFSCFVHIDMSYFTHIYKIISLIMLYGFLLFNYSDICFVLMFFPLFNLLFFSLRFQGWFSLMIPSQHRALCLLFCGLYFSLWFFLSFISQLGISPKAFDILPNRYP